MEVLSLMTGRTLVSNDGFSGDFSLLSILSRFLFFTYERNFLVKLRNLLLKGANHIPLVLHLIDELFAL